MLFIVYSNSIIDALESFRADFIITYSYAPPQRLSP